MFYVYVLRSDIKETFYTGFTSDLLTRKKRHDMGQVRTTKNWRPLTLVYYEFCLTKKDALHREIYLKTAWGKKFIKNRLKYYLTGSLRNRRATVR